MLKQVKRERGIGLLELMLSLSIIAILLVMATRYFMTANESQKINNAVSIVNGIAGGAANFDAAFPGYNNSGVFMTMQSLVQGHFIPQSLGGSDGSGAKANPWGGNISVDSVTQQGYSVVLDGLPTDGGEYSVCNKLAGMINTSVKGTATCAGSVVTVNFN